MTVRLLSPALKKKAEKEVNENPKRLADDLQSFKEWLAKQPHLHSVQPCMYLLSNIVLVLTFTIVMLSF